MDEMMEILKNLDWSPLFISIKTGIVATIFSFFLGIYAARKVVKTTPGKKAIIDGILTLPMVLPPTVAGFFLLLIFSRRRPFGIFLFENFGIKVVQTWLGCILAATVISFPLMYRNARAAMEQIDVNLIYAGRTLGMSDTEIFLESSDPDRRAWNRIRNDSNICQSTRRIWSDIYACRKYSGKDRNNLAEDCNGHSGRRLYDSGRVGCDCHGDRIPGDLPDESDLGQENEECQEVVRDGDRSKDSEKTEYI